MIFLIAILLILLLMLVFIGVAGYAYYVTADPPASELAGEGDAGASPTAQRDN